MVRRDLRPDIPDNLIGRPHVPPDHIQNRLVEFPPVIELHDGDKKAFFKDVLVV